MLQDILTTFKKIYDEKGDDLLINDYVLSPGTYILVDLDSKINMQLEVNDLKNEKIDNSYYKFSELDYYSKLIDMNKSVDTKKVIHSNNCLSFFVKKENLFNDKLTQEIFDTYFEFVRDPISKYKNDKDKRMIYERYADTVGSPEEMYKDKLYDWLVNNSDNVKTKIMNDKTYLKIFLNVSTDIYKKESMRYILPNIYNNNAYNVIVNNEIYGFPNNNLGLNQKKQYLENRTRKTTVPYLISDSNVILQKKFFDYLMNLTSSGKNNIYIDKEKIIGIDNSSTLDSNFKGQFLRIKKGKNEAEIIDCDYISCYQVEISNMKKLLAIKVDFNKVNKINQIGTGEFQTISELKETIDTIYFNKYLSNNFFTEAKDLNLKNEFVKKSLLKYRNALFTWFYKGNSAQVEQIFDKMSLGFISNSIFTGNNLKAIEQFNLRHIIKNYFNGGVSMSDKLKTIFESTFEKINQSQTGLFENNEEFFFAVGQVTSYLLSLSKASKKYQSLANPILTAKSEKRLKEEVNRLYLKYNHAIEKPNKRFDNLLAMINGYSSTVERNPELLIAGYLYSNIIYFKEDKKNVK